MTDTQKAEAYFSETKGYLALWFGLLAGPTALALDLLISFALVPRLCPEGNAFPLHLISFCAIAVSGLGVFIAWQSWRRAGREWPRDEWGVLSRSRFMAMQGLLLSGLFLIAVIANAVPRFILGPCMK